ncbi:MAG TPA: ABC transporter ATP-binding protein [Gemmatimonadaceae bacterium]|nr:ABC transporter ATP-binding protein [Gemmatimonadaceae bacterium]
MTTMTMLPVLQPEPVRATLPDRSVEAPVLAVHGLVKRYARGAAPAVDDVSFTVRRGEIMAVVGESGCGKSTLLRLVAGLEVPDAGSVEIGGRTVAGAGRWVSPEKRGVGMVFQDFALFPHMTVEGNVRYGLREMPRAERASRVAEMLELVGLAGLGARYPHQLSGGQQQRVALARALAGEPSILLLDEPFSSLDTALKRSLREEMRAILERTSTTTLLVVHDAEDVMMLADRAAVLRAGRVLQEADPDTLYRKPQDEYVAHFFGETNVLPGRPCEGGFETVLGIVPCATAATSRGPVRLCVRPEHLELGLGLGVGEPAVVERVHVAGVRRRVVVRLDGGAEPGERLIMHLGAEPPLEVGDRVRVLPRADCVHVIGG